MDVEYLGVDLLSLNAQQIYGPKGLDFYVREGVQIRRSFWVVARNSARGVPKTQRIVASQKP
jgi:cysteine sulfinate desulfinase/cysteine desulfurase-like protein